MKMTLRAAAVTAVVTGCVAFLGASALAQNAKPAAKGAAVNPMQAILEDVEIKVLLEDLSRRLKRPLVYSPKVIKKSTAKVFIPRDVTVSGDEYIDLVNTLLEIEEIAIVVTEKMIRVVPLRDAAKTPRTIDPTGKSNDTVITKVYRLKNVDVGQVIQPLGSILSNKNSKPVAIANQNMVMVSDIASNMKLVDQVIEMLDQPPEEVEVETIQLLHSDPKEVFASLSKFLSQSKRVQSRIKGATAPMIIPESRTNSLIIAGTADDRKRLKDMIAKLDRKTPEGKSTIHYYKVKNGKAEDLAKVLESLFSKKQKAAGTKKAAAVLKEGAPSIVPVADQNALIIIADPTNYEELREVLVQMDIIRPQVLIEATIVEMTLEKAEAFGIDWATVELPGTGETIGFAGTGFGLGAGAPAENVAAAMSSGKSGIIGGVVKNVLDSDGNEVNVVPLVIQASKDDNDVDLLAVPKLMTNDNEEATIDIIDKLPYNQQNYSSDGNPTSLTFGGYQEAGIKLKITPHISEADHLRLEIEQTIDAFAPSELASTIVDRPPVVSRHATATVTVPDRSTVVLGGMTRNDVSSSEAKIPGLWRIPYLGKLFMHTSRSEKSVTLYMFIKPYIMRTLDQAVKATDSIKIDVEERRKTFEQDR